MGGTVEGTVGVIVGGAVGVTVGGTVGVTVEETGGTVGGTVRGVVGCRCYKQSRPHITKERTLYTRLNVKHVQWVLDS